MVRLAPRSTRTDTLSLHDALPILYAENRSFSNLYGNFPGVRHPLSAVPASRYAQLDRDGRTQLARLPKIWGGLVPRPQNVGGRHFEITQDQIDGLPNRPFHRTDAQGAPLPPGVITRDLWHRFYQNQMQERKSTRLNSRH